MDERLDYLLNFWDPREGDEVMDAGESVTARIAEIYDYYQVRLQGGKGQASLPTTVAFVQDLTWCPTAERVKAILMDMGAELLDDSIGFMGSYFPYPTEVLDYAEVFRQIRHLAQLKGQKDPIYTMPRPGKHIL